MSDELQYASRMSDADALMWSIEKDPLLRSTITTLMVLDAPIDHERFLHTMERATRIIPRLRQRVRSNPLSLAPPRWEIDPHYDLNYHVRWTKATGDGTFRDLLSMAEPIGMQGFDRARPLWEVVVVEGLEDDASALIMKIHHSITDGVGGVKMMLEIFDFERDAEPKGPLPDAPEVKVLNQAERFVDATVHETRRQVSSTQRTVAAGIGRLADPSESARRLGHTAASLARFLRPAAEPMSPLMLDRSLSQRFDALTLPLDEMKTAARKAGGRLNDAFVAGVTGGYRRYHLRHDAPTDALRMGMPISVRDETNEGQAGNQFVPARIEVPIATVDPVERMGAIHKIVELTRAEPYLSLSDQVSGVINRIPTTVTTAMFGSLLKAVDFTTSNVPGSPVPVFVAGAQLTRHLAFGPMAGAGANITLMSLCDEIHVGFNTDPAAVPDPDAFMEDMAEGFDEVRSVA
ncbi:MAG: wax ester/triacylglycerol synthase domain-containing protein [Acidimicrobiales bacterium]